MTTFRARRREDPFSGPNNISVQVFAGADADRRQLAGEVRLREEEVDEFCRRVNGEYVTKTGRVLTDADFETLADEAEAGYDVSHLIDKAARRPADADSSPQPNDPEGDTMNDPLTMEIRADGDGLYEVTIIGHFSSESVLRLTAMVTTLDEAGLSAEVEGGVPTDHPSGVRVRFQPEMWVDDNAVPVGDEEADEWNVSEETAALLAQAGTGAHALDFVREDAFTPQWIREWDGPFTISVPEQRLG